VSSPVTLEAAKAALEEWARPATRSHAGDVHIASVSELGVVTVEFSGACRACPLQPVTFATAVLPAFDKLSGVADVRCETVRVSPHAMRRMRALMGGASVQATSSAASDSLGGVSGPRQ
jgi:Fe-S cluster biogenesis protein NfuA